MRSQIIVTQYSSKTPEYFLDGENLFFQKITEELIGVFSST